MGRRVDPGGLTLYWAAVEADRGRVAASAPLSLLVVAAAIGGALAGCHPSGTPVVDPIYAAAFAAAVTWAAARAPRGTLLWLGVLAVVMSRGWLVLPALAALLLAFAGVWPRRPNAILGALTGALAVQVVLRWPPIAFHGATALVAVAATGPCLVGAVRTLSAPARRRVRRWTFGLITLAIVLSIPAAVGALLARSELSQGIDQAQGALGSIGNGTTAYGAAQLQAASTDFASAASSTDSWWTAGARLVPVVAQQRQAVGQASAVARDVTATASLQAAGVNYQELRYSDGQLNLGRVSALAGPLGIVDGQLTSAAAQLRSLQSGWLVQPVQSRLDQLDTKVFGAQASASLAAQLVQAAPSLLGGDGVRHYFIAFMDPAESRGLGGLIASYGELTADQGHLTLTRSGDISQLNEALPKGGGHLTGPADYLARYGAFHPQKLMQDLSYAPDLPTVADVIRQLYPQAGGDPIDGVLALDPYGLAALIGLTGPIEVPGLGRLTSANTASELLEGQYTAFPSQPERGARLRPRCPQDRVPQADHRVAARPPCAVRRAGLRRPSGAHRVLELRQGGSARARPPRPGRRLPGRPWPRSAGRDHPERSQQQDRRLPAAFHLRCGDLRPVERGGGVPGHDHPAQRGPRPGPPERGDRQLFRQRTAVRDQRDVAHPLQPARVALRHRQRPESRSERRG